MKISSFSIADYIELNYDITGDIDQKQLEQVKELVINNYDYNMDKTLFYPNELSYFNNLESCTFMNFEINEEILININKLRNLKELVFDNCTLSYPIKLNNKIEKLYIEASNGEFISIASKELEELVVYASDEIDINNLIQYKNLNRLALLNTNIENEESLKIFNPSCEIKILGCKINNLENIKNSNITYDPNTYLRVGDVF